MSQMTTAPRRELILRLPVLPLWVLFVSGVRACARQAQNSLKLLLLLLLLLLPQQQLLLQQLLLIYYYYY